MKDVSRLYEHLGDVKHYEKCIANKVGASRIAKNLSDVVKSVGCVCEDLKNTVQSNEAFMEDLAGPPEHIT